MFPDLTNELEARLAALIAGGNVQDLEFVLGVLAAFEGKPCVYRDRARDRRRRGTPESRLLAEARSVLRETGVVRGEFGFAEPPHRAQGIARTVAWRSERRVRMFATDQIRELDQLIAAENRSAEASIALRKLEYGEELDGGEER
ncbi:MAG: hypothetical protein MZV70_39380 [Desulfobacterales bacterium]|nr:hypothetical protein [Desulfobacterales bacterium]